MSIGRFIGGLHAIKGLGFWLPVIKLSHPQHISISKSGCLHNAMATYSTMYFFALAYLALCAVLQLWHTGPAAGSASGYECFTLGLFDTCGRCRDHGRVAPMVFVYRTQRFNEACKPNLWRPKFHDTTGPRVGFLGKSNLGVNGLYRLRCSSYI